MFLYTQLKPDKTIMAHPTPMLTKGVVLVSKNPPELNGQKSFNMNMSSRIVPLNIVRIFIISDKNVE